MTAILSILNRLLSRFEAEDGSYLVYEGNDQCLKA